MQFTIPVPWWFYAIIALMIVLPLIAGLVGQMMNERRYARAGLSEIRRMNWEDFEHYLAHLFRSLGYKAEVTPPQGDYGVDVIVTDSSGRRIAVQAKHWKTKRVGAPDVQKTIGGAAYYGCQKAIVVTISGYTEQAREMARKTHVELWDLKKLGDVMEQARARGAGAQVAATAPAPVARQSTPSAAAPRTVGMPQATRPPASLGVPVKPAPSTGPSCPECKSPMAARTVNGKSIWLCSRFPNCKGTRLKD